MSKGATSFLLSCMLVFETTLALEEESPNRWIWTRVVQIEEQTTPVSATISSSHPTSTYLPTSTSSPSVTSSSLAHTASTSSGSFNVLPSREMAPDTAQVLQKNTSMAHDGIIIGAVLGSFLGFILLVILVLLALNFCGFKFRRGNLSGQSKVGGESTKENALSDIEKGLGPAGINSNNSELTQATTIRYGSSIPVISEPVRGDATPFEPPNLLGSRGMNTNTLNQSAHTPYSVPLQSSATLAHSERKIKLRQESMTAPRRAPQCPSLAPPLVVPAFEHHLHENEEIIHLPPALNLSDIRNSVFSIASVQPLFASSQREPVSAQDSQTTANSTQESTKESVKSGSGASAGSSSLATHISRPNTSEGVALEQNMLHEPESALNTTDNTQMRLPSRMSVSSSLYSEGSGSAHNSQLPRELHHRQSDTTIPSPLAQSMNYMTAPYSRRHVESNITAMKRAKDHTPDSYDDGLGEYPEFEFYEGDATPTPVLPTQEDIPTPSIPPAPSASRRLKSLNYIKKLKSTRKSRNSNLSTINSEPCNVSSLVSKNRAELGEGAQGVGNVTNPLSRRTSHRDDASMVSSLEDPLENYVRYTTVYDPDKIYQQIPGELQE